MNDRLNKYIDELFKDAPDNARTREYKEEILKNNEEKLADLIAEGMDLEEAFKTVAAGMGDMNELFESLREGGETAENKEAGASTAQQDKRKRKISAAGIVFIVLGALLIAAMLFGGLVWVGANAYRTHGLGSVIEESFGDKLEEGADKLEEEIEAGIEAGFGGTYESGTYYFEPGDFSDVVINWPSGDVNIYVSEDGRVAVKEKVHGITANPMSCYVSKNKLYIRHSEGNIQSLINIGSKTLEIYLPSEMAEYADLHIKTASASVNVCETLHFNEAEIKSASGDIRINGIEAKKLDVESTSGRIDINNVRSAELDAETTSGAITIFGVNANELEASSKSGSIELSQTEFNKGEADTVSGGIDIKLTAIPAELDMESTSGGIKLTVPKAGGFKLLYESTSGDLVTDLPLNKTINSPGYYYGDKAEGVFEAETTSGNLTITAE